MEEIKKITEEIRKKLNAPLDSKAIKPHPTKKYLSTIKAIYVIERLNDVFGTGSYTLESTLIEKIGKMVVVKAFLKIPAYGVSLEAFGGNDNDDLGDAYKGAVTDALTKMGSYLEIGIDVFKGLDDSHGAAVADKKNKEPQKEEPAAAKPTVWLNRGTESWKKALEYLKNGGTITEIEKKYKMSKVDRETLLSEAI